MHAILSQPAIENSNTNAVLVTVLTRTDGQAAGKTFRLDGDSVSKSVVAHTGQYHAVTVNLDGDTPLAILDAYRRLVESLTPAQSIILGHAPDAGGQPYRILPVALLAKRIGVTIDKAGGFHLLDGQLTCARLKANFRPSRLLLFE